MPMAKDYQRMIALDARRGLSRAKSTHPGAPRARASRVARLLAIAHELAERNAILLRESDHRIKNSLQIVSSLVLMQARNPGLSTAAEALAATAARIRAIGLIHDALQDTRGADAVDLAAVLATMCRALDDMGGTERAVTIVVVAEPVTASADIAQPVVLLVNELVINALRHAFEGDRPGTIRVGVARTEGGLRIVVADDGPGLPEGAVHGEGKGFGMRLVRAMVEQIGGALSVENKGGARFTITAPLP